MRFRDAIKFSLELILPERAILAVERLALERIGQSKAAQKQPPAPTIDQASNSNDARKIIEELDSSQFGGPSFGPQTITLMCVALEQVLASLPQPIADDCARVIAGSILKIAATGERDPVRLEVQAMSALKETSNEPPSPIVREE
jgi:hypothetical protein